MLYSYHTTKFRSNPFWNQKSVLKKEDVVRFSIDEITNE